MSQIRYYKDMKQPKLTRKQKAFADTLLADNKISATQAALQTYGKPNKPTTYATANDIASSNLQKPLILAYLAKYSQQAESNLVRVANYSTEMGETFSSEGAKYAAVSVQANREVLDRVHGKSIQRQEVHSTSVNLHLNLSDVTE